MLTFAFDRIRARDTERTLLEVVLSQTNDQLRERCDSDPGWFMTGPLIGRPINGAFVGTDPDQNQPRAKSRSTALRAVRLRRAVRWVRDQRRRSCPATSDCSCATRRRRSSPHVSQPKARGIQEWCQHRLARQQVRTICSPGWHRGRTNGVTACCLRILRSSIIAAMALAAASPTVFRIRRMAADARQSVDSGFTSIAPEKLKDELSSLTFVYNDAMTELAMRKARIEDQDVALKRLVQAADAEALKPLATLETSLGASLRERPKEGSDARSFLQAHDLRGQLENLTAATELTRRSRAAARAPCDLVALTRRVIDRGAASRTRGVDVEEGTVPATRWSSTATSRCSNVRSRT